MKKWRESEQLLWKCSLGIALGYTQATFSWKLFIFSSHFHTKTIHFRLLGTLNPLYPGYMFIKAVHILFIFSHKNNTCVDYCGLSTLYTALGYIQATFFTKCCHFLFTFSDKNNTFFIIGDSRPSVQPWAIPRLHFSQNAVTFFSRGHTKTIHVSISGDSRLSVQPCAISRLHFSQNADTFFSYFHTKTIHVSITGAPNPGYNPVDVSWCILIHHINIMLMHVDHLDFSS
jgi:hypothetical protein